MSVRSPSGKRKKTPPHQWLQEPNTSAGGLPGGSKCWAEGLEGPSLAASGASAEEDCAGLPLRNGLKPAPPARHSPMAHQGHRVFVRGQWPYLMGLSTDLLLLAAWLGVRQIWSWFPAVSEMCPLAQGKWKREGPRFSGRAAARCGGGRRQPQSSPAWKEGLQGKGLVAVQSDKKAASSRPSPCIFRTEAPLVALHICTED